MTIVILYLKKYIRTLSFLSILMLSIIGLIIYSITLFFMKIKFLDDFILNKIKSMKGTK